MNVALTIAGSDSGGGAGIQADIKSMQANGVYAASVVTAITAQNTLTVTEAFELPLSLIEKQLDAVFEDISVRATKTGMLSSSQVIELVARELAAREIAPLVVDPVMISKSGYELLAEDAVETLKTKLLPLATVVTPNAHEAQHLTGIDVASTDAATEAAKAIFEMGPRAVLVKGGHIDTDDDAVDVLFDGKNTYTFAAPRILTKNTHGSGCTYASAIAANLARGMPLRESIARAKRYVTDAIRHGLSIGQGHGPTNHFYFLKDVEVFPIGEG